METNLLLDEHQLFERLCEPSMLYHGFIEVRRNKGAPGIDGVSISDFEANLEEELNQLSMEIETWKYTPKPVRQVEIDKPGSAEKRRLGIPCVRDRVVDATMKILMEPILLSQFSTHSFGFIPSRGQNLAVSEAQRIVKSGKEIVVDIDIAKFLDHSS